MKLFVLFEKVFDEYWFNEGLGRAVGACFDEEQAREIVRQHTLDFWRSSPPPAALECLDDIVKAAGYRLDIVEEPELFSLLIAQADEHDSDVLIVLQIVAVDVDALPRAPEDRSIALHQLSTLLAPWAPDAARALKEDA